MKNSKWMRFLLIALSVAMVLSLFACGGNGGTTEETTVDNTEDTTVEDTTVEDTTVEDTTVEDTTVEDTTVEDTTVEDTTEEDTTAAEPVFEGNWHASVDAFIADNDGNLGAWADGDYSSIDTLILGASANKGSAGIVADGTGAYPSVSGNYICYFGGWVAVDGHSVENFVCNVYAADGTLLKTVTLAIREAEAGLSGTVQGMLGYAATTDVPRIGNVEEMIDLTEYEGQTVTVIYSVDIVDTEFTLDIVKIDVEVPALPEEETTAPVEINVELGANALAGITNTTNVGSIALSADGSYVTVKPTANTDDIYFYAYSGNANVTGRYAIIKYRATGKVTHFNIYASTSRDGATDGNDLVTAYIVADGEWHVMLIDLAAVKTVEADENGDYTVKFLRIDPFRGIGNATGDEEVDIAYVGIHESVYNLDLVANSSSMLELSNQFTFSVDSADLGGTAFSGGWNAEGGLKNSVTVSRDNANIAITGGWIAVNGQAFTNMGVYYKIVDAEGNATKLTKAGMNIKAAEEGVINHCATANPGATPMRVNTDKGGLVFPDLKAYSGQTVTIYVYAISDSMWEEQGVIAGRTILVLTVTVERSFKVSVNGVDYEDVAEAFAAAKDGDTVKFGKDVTLDTVIDVNKAVTVDLNGKTVTGSFNAGEGGALTIGGGTLAGEITTEDGGRAIVNNGTFIGFDPSEFVPYGFYAKANGTTYTVVPTYADLNVVWTGQDLLTQLTDNRGDFTANHSVVLNADGTVRYTKGTAGGDSGFSFYVNNTDAYNNTVATGQYFVIKYRTNAAGVLAATLFSSTTEDGAKGVKYGDYAPMNQFFGDNEWHVAVIDLASVCAGGVVAVDGVYYVNFIRLDLTNRLAAGEILDIAYAGFCDSLDDIYAGETNVGLAELTADYRADIADATAGLASINPNESIFRTVTSNNITFNGWMARKVPFNSVVYKIVDANGVETAWTVNEGAIVTPEAGLADIVIGWMNSPESQGAAFVYRHGVSIDLSAYAGQTVTVYVANANVVDGSFNAIVPMFTITANVPQ